MSSPVSSVLECRDLVCRRAPLSLQVGHAVFARDAFHLLIGEPDSGHELLLRILGLLEVPDEGELIMEGQPIRELSEDARMKLREQRLGFVFAAPFLLSAFTVIENVAMPLFKVSEVSPPEARSRSEALLEFVGLTDAAQTPCADLAPMAQHRASLARALVNEPGALLIESLDASLAGEELRAFAALLRRSAAQFGVAVIATASPRFAPEIGDRIFEVSNGLLACVEKSFPVSET